jgi:hypothetical protein
MTEAEKDCARYVLVAICATFLLVASFFCCALCMLCDVLQKVEDLEHKIIQKLNHLIELRECNRRRDYTSSIFGRESPPPSYENFSGQ